MTTLSELEKQLNLGKRAKVSKKERAASNFSIHVIATYVTNLVSEQGDAKVDMSSLIFATTETSFSHNFIQTLRSVI